MSEEKMRAEFEAWCRQNNGIPARLDGTDQYIVEAIQAAWVAWQAATASKQREIAELSAQVEMMRGLPDEDGLTRCPHCGGKPYYSAVEEYDDRRYMRMTLTCCAEYEARLNYGTYRHMTEAQIKEHLVESLREQFNAREALTLEPSAALLAHDNEVATKALEEAEIICASYSDWCGPFGIYQNEQIATEAAGECALKIKNLIAERRNRK